LSLIVFVFTYLPGSHSQEAFSWLNFFE
jgi:hypothetical protein